MKNTIVAVDTETTGLIPGYHEIIEAAFVPLNEDLEYDKDIPRLILLIKPEFPERIEPEALAINGLNLDMLNEVGISKGDAVRAILNWINTELPGKQIAPLAQNWIFDRGFLAALLSETHFKKAFHYSYRDTKPLMEALNDRAILKGQEIPFKSTSLVNVTKLLGIHFDNAHTALGDCEITIEVYKKLLEMMECQRTKSVYGICCVCGYDKPEQSDCEKRKDGIHCPHWWDGPEGDPDNNDEPVDPANFEPTSIS